MTLQQSSKIYVAGHRGMASSAIVRRLQSAGYLLTKLHAPNLHGPEDSYYPAKSHILPTLNRRLASVYSHPLPGSSLLHLVLESTK